MHCTGHHFEGYTVGGDFLFSYQMENLQHGSDMWEKIASVVPIHLDVSEERITLQWNTDTSRLVIVNPEILLLWLVSRDAIPIQHGTCFSAGFRGPSFHYYLPHQIHRFGGPFVITCPKCSDYFDELNTKKDNGFLTLGAFIRYQHSHRRHTPRSRRCL